ncbi:MAG TPA: wax ester/triacylglycerol synthase family O-acyltransferase [Acidimicrobiales bacterium]|nr:wax ester/triacylglycerol synthase family O-acyltransferase [Acidimicrobiales bacterium]
MKRLTGLDAAFVYAETPTMHMHVSMVAVFDPATMPGGYSFDRVRQLVAARLPLIPMFRQRLVEVPFRLHHPVLVDDPEFDLDYHFRRVAVPAPGTMRELTELAGDFVSRPLDRGKPLWEMWVVEGLEEGHIGVMAKVHHSMVDGVTGAEVLVHLMDLEPDAPAVSEATTDGEATAGERIPTDLELVTYALRSMATRPALVAKTIPATVGSLLRIVQRRRGGEGGMAAPFTAPRAPFNAALTPHRSVAVTTLSLDDIKAVKNAFGATVNDVVLALCSGALRHYLAGRGELPEESLVSVVPISVRTEGAEGANQVSAMFVSLASDLAHPAERLRAIASGTKGAKEEHHALGADTLRNWAEFATPALFARASRAYSQMRLADRHRPIHNVIISNVPGPPFPLYMAGARLVALAPLGPVMEGAGLNITVISYMDQIDVGLIACRELVPDLWDLADAFAVSMGELKKAADL